MSFVSVNLEENTSKRDNTVEQPPVFPSPKEDQSGAGSRKQFINSEDTKS